MIDQKFAANALFEAAQICRKSAVIRVYRFSKISPDLAGRFLSLKNWKVVINRSEIVDGPTFGL